MRSTERMAKHRRAGLDSVAEVELEFQGRLPAIFSATGLIAYGFIAVAKFGFARLFPLFWNTARDFRLVLKFGTSLS
jgi:hypothetical protein